MAAVVSSEGTCLVGTDSDDVICHPGLRGSLSRLQLEYVDIVFANRTDVNSPMEGQCSNPPHACVSAYTCALLLCVCALACVRTCVHVHILVPVYC